MDDFCKKLAQEDGVQLPEDFSFGEMVERISRSIKMIPGMLNASAVLRKNGRHSERGVYFLPAPTSLGSIQDSGDVSAHPSSPKTYYPKLPIPNPNPRPNPGEGRHVPRNLDWSHPLTHTILPYPHPSPYFWNIQYFTHTTIKPPGLLHISHPPLLRFPTPM